MSNSELDCSKPSNGTTNDTVHSQEKEEEEAELDYCPPWSYDLIKGIVMANDGIDQETSEEYSEAIRLYKKALKYFNYAMNLMEGEASKKIVRKKARYFQKRIEDLENKHCDKENQFSNN